MYSLKVQIVRQKDFWVSLPTRQKTDSLLYCFCVLHLVPFLLTFVRCCNQHGMCVKNSRIWQVSLTMLWKRSCSMWVESKSPPTPTTPFPITFLFVLLFLVQLWLTSKKMLTKACTENTSDLFGHEKGEYRFSPRCLHPCDLRLSVTLQLNRKQLNAADDIGRGRLMAKSH